MNSYVLILSVGPVQGFIAAARRSRDLWAGSWMLSELAKAVAKSLHDNGAKLIFPYVEKDKNKILKPNSSFSVGNKIQAVVYAKNDDELIKIADNAKKAAQYRFNEMAAEALEKLNKQQSKLLRKIIWYSQVNDYVEVQYAWAKFPHDDSYHDAYENASKLLAARKATRDFDALENPICEKCGTYIRKGLPKSSLDGARETVLPEKENDGLRQKLRLSDSEQLDCVGVMKRLCGDTEQFTPITRVAADSWLREKIPTETLPTIKKIYRELVRRGLATPVTGNNGIYHEDHKKNNNKGFGYDAQFLYRSRLEAELNKTQNEEYKNLLKKLRNVLMPIWEKDGEPCYYWVMLLADGDRMGELLDKAKKQDQHQEITKQLSAFAQEVPETMRSFQAQCVYSGGDDVLGFVPLDKAIDCAEALKKSFSDHLDKAVDYLKKDDSIQIEHNPTLSVGLAICHIMTPLGNVRALAQRAEKEAKGDNYPKEQQRNALGISLALRGGTTMDMRLRWKNDTKDDTKALDAFKEWIGSYRNQTLSSRIAYDCRDIFMRTDFPPPKNKNHQADSKDDDHVTDDLRKHIDLVNHIRATEFNLMLKRARTPNGKELSYDLKKELTTRLKQLSGLSSSQISPCEKNDIAKIDDWAKVNKGVEKKSQLKVVALDKLATELIIARWLAARTQRDLGREN